MKYELSMDKTTLCFNFRKWFINGYCTDYPFSWYSSVSLFLDGFIHKYIQDICVILKSIEYILMNEPIQK